MFPRKKILVVGKIQNLGNEHRDSTINPHASKTNRIAGLMINSILLEFKCSYGRLQPDLQDILIRNI